jgi:S-DNA-T family DNA segregation ATPase FtsK/SpoIIIE
VLAGRTESGQDWHISLARPASHLLAAGESGADKTSVTWRSLVSIAPAIRDGLVRVSGIDPKGTELAYGRGIFARHAVTGAEALAVLYDLSPGCPGVGRRCAGPDRSAWHHVLPGID